MNQTLKENLSTLVLETGRDWVTLLPLAIFCAQNSPYVHSLTPFEIMYRAPPPITRQVQLPSAEDPSPGYLNVLQALAKVQQEIWPLIRAYYEGGKIPSLEHGIVPGDMV